MASARFRAKAKERQNELDKLKAQVAQLRREKRDLEALNAKTREDAAAEAERQRASTMAWIVDHFWLRRKVHFKTLANSVRWMVSGKYRPGMSEAVAELMARQTASLSAEADKSGLTAEEMEADQDLSGLRRRRRARGVGGPVARRGGERGVARGAARAPGRVRGRRRTEPRRLRGEPASYLRAEDQDVPHRLLQETLGARKMREERRRSARRPHTR